MPVASKIPVSFLLSPFVRIVIYLIDYINNNNNNGLKPEQKLIPSKSIHIALRMVY
jgi:hypothetical protein